MVSQTVFSPRSKNAASTTVKIICSPLHSTPNYQWVKAFLLVCSTRSQCVARCANRLRRARQTTTPKLFQFWQGSAFRLRDRDAGSELQLEDAPTWLWQLVSRRRSIHCQTHASGHRRRSRQTRSARGNRWPQHHRGYHWFADWGRDTMIALPGLTLTTGRPEVARRIFAGLRALRRWRHAS